MTLADNAFHKVIRKQIKVQSYNFSIKVNIFCKFLASFE